MFFFPSSSVKAGSALRGGKIGSSLKFHSGETLAQLLFTPPDPSPGGFFFRCPQGGLHFGSSVLLDGRGELGRFT